MSYTNSNFIAIETYAELNDTISANETLFDYYAEQVAAALSIYCTPPLVVLGTIGNLVSVFVFYSSKLRLQSTSQYLSALAISDTVFLLQLLPPWMNAAQISNIFNQQGFCQIFQYLSYVACCLSAWLVVAFTVERFVAVLYPLQRNSICTIKRARHIIGTIVVASLLLNVPMLWLVNPTIMLQIDKENQDYAATFNIVDTAMAFTIPLAVIIVLNSWITVGVCRLERARHQLLREQGPPAARAQRALPLRALASPRSQQRVTRMLLIVSTVFVVLNMPAYTMRLLAYAYNLDTEQENFRRRWAALQQVAQMFFYTNFGINFILYCLSGQNFRRALKLAMPTALRRRARRAAVVRRGAGAPSHATRAGSVNTSFVSNCTEGSTNCAGAVVTPTSRRWRRDPFVTRWTFDNSRQRAYPPQDYTEEVEMQVFPSTTE